MGNHQITFGGGINRTFHQAKTSSRGIGDFDFRTGRGSTRVALINFMVGYTDRFIQGALSRHNPMRWFPRLYVSDTWSVTSGFNLTYGVRWDPAMPELRLNDTGYSFERERFDQGIQSTVHNNAAPGFFYFGDPGFPDNSGGIEKRWNKFSPRIGFAWDVTGDGRTSIRSSYSYNYEIVPMEWANEMGNAPPFGNRVEVNGVNFEDPWANTPGGNPHPFTLGPDVRFGSGGNYPILPTDFFGPDTSSWNLSIQRELPADTLVPVSYLGSIVNHFMGVQQINPAVFFPGETDANGNCFAEGFTFKSDSRGREGRTCSSSGNTQSRRILNLLRPGAGDPSGLGIQGPGLILGAMTDRDPSGTQSYSGLLMTLRSRFSERLNVNANYTWSHCTGDYNGGNPTAGPNTDQTHTQPLNRRADWGDCISDRRHVLNLTTVVGTPEFANRTARMLFTDWQLAVIYRRSSGAPGDIITDEDTALNGTATGHQRGDQILPNIYGDRSGGADTQYLNPDAVALPEEGTFGNMGRSIVTGPTQWDFDLALTRSFNIGEDQSLELRAEAYNVTNSFRGRGSRGFWEVGDRDFGEFTARNRSARSPRIMQFALKYVF